MEEFWNERYSGKNFAYGTEPNVFFKQSIDAIALVFLHLPPEKRKALHKTIVNWLQSGGYLIEEFFSKGQVGKISGGPIKKYQLSELFSVLEV